MIDLTLRRLKRPAIKGLVPQFGTTVDVTEKNKGGLSTTEVDANMALAYELQREVVVSTSDETSIVEYNAKIAIVADEAVTLKMNGASYGGCDIKITNRGTATATVEYNDSGSIQIPPDGYIRMEWTSREWWVEDTMNVQPVGANIKTFTYVVDSDQALIDWANNDRNRGQDYTSVLIKNGVWTCNKGVNLTETGTEVIVGEAGSKLVFDTPKMSGRDVGGVGGDKVLYYAKLERKPSRRVENVDILVSTGYSDNEYDNSYLYALVNLSNVYNCNVELRGKTPEEMTDVYLTNLYGLYSCYNVKDSTITLTSASTSAMENDYAFGLEQCYGVSLCHVRIGTRLWGAGTLYSPFSNCYGIDRCSISSVHDYTHPTGYEVNYTSMDNSVKAPNVPVFKNKDFYGA